MKLNFLLFLVIGIIFQGCSFEKQYESSSRIDSSTIISKRQRDSASILNSQEDQSNIIKDENDCVGARNCNTENLRNKIKNRHTKWDVTGGLDYDDYLGNGKWKFGVTLYNLAHDNIDDEFNIIVSTDCDCNITSIERTKM
ncbi:hypothetical protein [Aquirufa regiilacus]|uniref:Lipoprotein n=1 Tax=Aquirufa regiilacus TaxID=3024868 RepID=A0ABU3TQ87_9BACT|nr:hypothetical protein [Aquirufa sp. LEOWEIH-7C]MDU0808022.1 hypothetical protein [Aquirufa sp. LEOWEIH-7C]